MTIQKIDYPNNGGLNPTGDNPRIETGAVQFGEDWPGLFIRGDNAMAVALNLEVVLNWLKSCPYSPPANVRMAASSLAEIGEIIREDVILGG